MAILTDDPDWAPDLYEARVLAVAFSAPIRRAQLSGTMAMLEAIEAASSSHFIPGEPDLADIDAPDRRRNCSDGL